MKMPLTIAFRNMKRSVWVEQQIHERAAKLDEVCDRIMGCRVVVEMPHKRHHQGNFFSIRIDLTVPGNEIVVSRDAQEHSSAEDFQAVLRDAFDAAKRQLQDYARRRKHLVKAHVEAPHGRISRLFPEGYGFIETSDGREVYFHSNSLLNEKFANLELGTAVTFAEEDGDKGPQASSVRL